MQKARNYISTNSKKKAEFKRIWINGKETNYEINVKGDMYNVITGYKRKKSIGDSGYYIYTINIDGKLYILKTHRIIAALFIPIPKKYTDMGLGQLDLEVNHKDANKLNLDISNLEWCTSKENMDHAWRNGLITVGPDKEGSLSEEQVREILQYFKDGYGYTDIKRKTGTTASVIRDVCLGNHWSSYIRDEFDLEGVHVKGERVSDETVHNICKLLESGDYSIIEVSEKLGIPKSIVDSVVYKNNHKDISSKYDLTHITKYRNSPLIRHVCELIDEGLPNKEIAERLNVMKHYICGIKSCKNFKEIVKNYKFYKEENL